MGRISRKTFEKLQSFETMRILYAVDALDEIRGLVADGPNFEPPEVRDNLLKLHGMAHRLINEGCQLSDNEDIWELAFEIDDLIWSLIEYAEKIKSVLSDLTALAPDPDEEEDDDEDDEMD